jgi:uncharacterized membrane protein
MENDLNKKIILIIGLGLFIWLVGIIVTPMLAAAGMRKIATFAYFFYKPVCHQIAERSFLFDGFALAVCIRCFSFYLGGLSIVLYYLFQSKVRMWRILSYTLLIAPAAVDFILEKLQLYSNLEDLRIVTGFLLGIALFQMLIVSVSSPKLKTERKENLVYKISNKY